jgi:peptidyl-prolyl cis-trans isomerase B (cyclophilin B)
MKLLLAVIALSIFQPSSPDAEFDALQRGFATLYESLRAGGGVLPGDEAVIRVFRERVETYAGRNPGRRVLAMELQLSLWLDDQERINTLYAKLTKMTGDVNIGLAWAAHFQARDDRPKVGEIFNRLARTFPDNNEILVDWAKFYVDVNLYPRALEVIEAIDLDPAENPRAMIVMSDCLFAEHRFTEAVAALDSIPGPTLAADPALARQVEDLLRLRRPYPELWTLEQQIRSAEASADDLPRVELITVQGRIVLELFENEAPNTVANFIKLADSGYYDGVAFHRVLPNFMVQTGDPNSRPGADGVPGQGGPGYRIVDEFDRDGARMHFAGTLSMAKSPGLHTGGSQFFLTHTPPAHLNGKHTVFGRVVSGLDVVRSIEPNDLVETVTVLRKRDHEYEPQTLPLSGTPGLSLTDAIVPNELAEIRRALIPTTAPDTSDTEGK